VAQGVGPQFKTWYSKKKKKLRLIEYIVGEARMYVFCIYKFPSRSPINSFYSSVCDKENLENFTGLKTSGLNVDAFSLLI
jgi:hypothetical protein